MTLLAGTGCANLPDTIHSTRRAYELGANGVLIVPPFFFRDAPTAGLVEYFRILFAEAVPPTGGAMLYHIPQVTGVPVTPELLKRVQDQVGSKLAGLKDSSGSRAAFLELCRSFPELCIFSGLEDFLLEGLQTGAAGCITAGANVLAAPTAALIRAYHAGQDARPWQELLLKTRVVLPHTPYPVALKGLLAARYNDPAWLEVRPPLLPLAPEDQTILVNELREQNLL
jgi:4-hydroxy-tetrahydrodipicolinate synthase